MVTTGAPRMKITYATLSAENEELQAAFDGAVAHAREQLGERYPMLIGDERRFADDEFEDRSPIDTSLVVSRFPVGTREDVQDAVPAGGALIAGNTVIMKPSSDAPLMGYKFAEVLREVGVPAGVVNLVTGPGETVGSELEQNPGIDGLVFTGSYEVGMRLYSSFTRD